MIQGTRARIDDLDLFKKLWAESISTIVYLTIWILSSTVQDRTIIFFQVWYKGNLPAMDFMRIFGFNFYVFDKAKLKPKLSS